MALVNLKQSAKAKLLGMLRQDAGGIAEMRPHIYRPGPGTRIMGVQLTSPLVASGSASANVVKLSTDGAQVTDETVEVWDWKGMTGDAGKRGEVFWQGGRWWVIFIMRECP